MLDGSINLHGQFLLNFHFNLSSVDEETDQENEEEDSADNNDEVRVFTSKELSAEFAIVIVLNIIVRFANIDIFGIFKTFADEFFSTFLNL